MRRNVILILTSSLPQRDQNPKLPCRFGIGMFIGGALGVSETTGVIVSSAPPQRIADGKLAMFVPQVNET